METTGQWTEAGAVIRNLYFVGGPGLETVAGAGAGVPRMLSSLGPILNQSAVVYCLGTGGTDDMPLFEQLGNSIAACLDRIAFLQVTFRPVHGLPVVDLANWRVFYERLARLCRRFQDQGYREQILPRLRVFPVIFQERVGELEQAAGFLEWLRENFLLPSVVYPATAVEKGHFRSVGAPASWERTFVTESAGFSHEAILQSLFSHDLLDSLLTGDPEGPFPESPLCRESVVLDSDGRGRHCLLDQPGDRGPVPGVCAELANSVKQPDAPASSRCLSCLARVLQRSRREFRLNGRLDSWQQTSLRVARWLRQVGSKQDAADLLSSCMESFPAGQVPLALRLQKAICLYEEGALEQSLAELNEAQREAPSAAEVRHYQGLCEFAWRDYIEAADRFREALELGLAPPLRGEAEYFRGESHYHLGEFDDALEALSRSEREGQGGSEVSFYLGLSWLGKQRPAQATPFLEEALQRGPSPDDLFHVLFYLAFSAKESEEYASAVEYCRRAALVKPDSQELQNLMGFCFFKQGRYDDAIACFTKAIEIDPASGIDYANLGSNLREKGDLEGAARMYRRALALDPTIGFARESLARIEEKCKES